jgi:hypothetical protein
MLAEKPFSELITLFQQSDYTFISQYFTNFIFLPKLTKHNRNDSEVFRKIILNDIQIKVNEKQVYYFK